jgi:hypothetical protein
MRNISSANGGLENDGLYVGSVHISNGYMFVPLGSDGLDIYRIFNGGELELKVNVNSYKLYGRKMNI